jgi:glycosyltransferase involved in cell wall biosynthesis
MRIVYLAPGTGGTFYCQNCMRDAALARALRKHGHELTLVPVYLPILIDAKDINEDVPVFFGGVNVYLQQMSGIFRKTPRWLDKWLDVDWLLRWAAKREGSTEASSLGPLTLSMLEGVNGKQKKELDRLLDWLEEHEKPDMVHLSNSLLTGMAAEIKRRLKVPVVCTLQDEENWLDGIKPPYDKQCWDAMSKCANEIDAFIAVSKWYGDEMVTRMSLNGQAMNVVHLGIEFDEREPAKPASDPPVIGYLSKMCHSLGLGDLVDAFIELKNVPELKDLKLRATGGQHGPDFAFIEGLKKKLKQAGYENDVEFIAEFDLAHRRDFLRSLTVLSVPANEGEAFGLYIIEALSEGIPVVQPKVGGYPEVLAKSGGGILYDPKEPGALVESLKSLLLDPAKAEQLGREGRENVYRDFGVDNMAKGVAKVYEALA